MKEATTETEREREREKSFAHLSRARHCHTTRQTTCKIEFFFFFERHPKMRRRRLAQDDKADALCRSVALSWGYEHEKVAGM